MNKFFNNKNSIFKPLSVQKQLAANRRGKEVNAKLKFEKLCWTGLPKQ